MSTEAKVKDQELRLKMIKCGLWKCCFNCEHWVEYPGVTDEEKIYRFCGKYETFPPDEVILVGCSEHLQSPPF